MHSKNSTRDESTEMEATSTELVKYIYSVSAWQHPLLMLEGLSFVHIANFVFLDCAHIVCLVCLFFDTPFYVCLRARTCSMHCACYTSVFSMFLVFVSLQCMTDLSNICDSNFFSLR